MKSRSLEAILRYCGVFKSCQWNQEIIIVNALHTGILGIASANRHADFFRINNAQ